MKFYVLISRTLILRLHFYLENVSLMTQIPLSTKGGFLTLEPKLPTHGSPSNACGAKQFLQELPGICPLRIIQRLITQITTINSIHLGLSYCKFRMFSPTGLKMYEYFFRYAWIFFSSTPVVLYLFFLVLHFLNLREILPRLIYKMVVLIITKHCHLEDCLPSGERRPIYTNNNTQCSHSFSYWQHFSWKLIK